MKIRINRLFISLAMLIVVYSLSSCHEKGCTDKNAINYNSVADEDDGSCISCHAVTDTLGTITADLVDNNFSSPHYQQNVATFYVTQIKNKFEYSECGLNECILKVRIQSHVNSKMTFTFNLQANGNIFFNYTKNVIVLANESIYVDDVPASSISNPCGFITSTSVFVSANGNIIYN